ncbi:E3 ubiquitin-protein ligase MARCH6 isoform X2 [Cimex lectularius]|uniref:RING-type E3 ubiquitin transferase n=1 Tax=Cimex lectularius TaxID=79782 RepID=A0A8I6RJJ9_CIMLE|nr:E3 ubiquitin-protein ligase MARCH6 isoform X2 [Cimex lectularius]
MRAEIKTMMDDGVNENICRVCRSEGNSDRPLFHPCICAGSIKWIHQECLVQWMRYSQKEFCELCGYRFSFTPIYSPDMPRRLPLRDVVGGLLSSMATVVKCWLHYTFVAIAWLGIVPLTACRIYRCLFNGSVDSVLTLPLDMLSTENIGSDIFHGCFVVTCTLFAFIGLVWLKEQIVLGGGPDWLERGADEQPIGQNLPPQQIQPPLPPPPPPPLLVQERQGNNNPQEPPINEEVGEGGFGEGGVEEGVMAGGDWNPLDLDRAAEELTWERLLGLDGSLVFLEHVFWVVSLNTLFILVFAFCPYHMGHFVIVALGMKNHVNASHFQGLVTTLCGYCVIGICLVGLHSLAALCSLVKSRRVLGHCYVVVKVSLLSVVEIGVLPLICGWWLDICSLSLLDATLKDREASFRMAPGTSMFIHWLVGMVYVYYFASFILLLREVIRPGVLWFLRNLNDPDFSPIQEMIHLPIIKHVRRLVTSAVIFGSAVILMLWLPIRILRFIMPQFLPYVVTMQAEAQVTELSLELVLLQVILPALLEQSHTRAWLKALIRLWCVVVSHILDIKSYLLGEMQTQLPQVNALDQQAADDRQPVDLGAVHHALFQRGGPTGFQPYERPRFFFLRLFVLVILVCCSLVGVSLITLTVPVALGRQVMVHYPQLTNSGPGGQIHELYTAACGTYMCCVMARAVTFILSWLPQGRRAIVEMLYNWLVLTGKSLIAGILLIGIIPLLSGLLLELILVMPLRVPLEQTPVLWFWQDWALGVLYTKIVCAITMMGPEWAMRQAIERAYRDGLRNMQLKFIIVELAMPVIGLLAIALALPYVIAQSIIPLFVSNTFIRVVVARRIYPCTLLLLVVCVLIVFHIKQFAKLYEHIKNDKYLVGRRLVNYHHKSLTS